MVAVLGTDCLGRGKSKDRNGEIVFKALQYFRWESERARTRVTAVEIVRYRFWIGHWLSEQRRRSRMIPWFLPEQTRGMELPLPDKEKLQKEQILAGRPGVQI